MDLSPEALRGAEFTERFRGYDAAEVDSFLNEAADALDGLLAEHSEPMAAVAAERAREAIEEVRRESLVAVEDLQRRRDALETAVADLRRTLRERRLGAVEELALIDAALEEMPEAAGSGTAATDGDGSPGEVEEEADTFLERLEQAAAESGAPEAG